MAKLTLDQALIELFIGAMNANGHVVPDEPETVHKIVEAALLKSQL
jgi:hypothetical protein